VTVEPGVTFAQLDAFLTGRQSQLFLPTIGGSGQASIVGNAVERGHGIGPNPRRADAVAAIEAVLADGSEVRTGFAGATTFSGAAAHRHGVGPSLAGLFLQGRLAVVTRMTLHLERRPEALTLFGGRIGDGAALAGVLELLRPMLLDGSLGRSLFTVWNRYKYAACRQNYPWEAMRGEVPLDLAAVGTQPDWLFTGALYAPSVAHARVARHALANLTGVVASFRILEPEDPEFHRAAPKFLGTPGPDNLRSMYWRKPRGMPDSPEPERDRCGVLQLCPLLPMGRRAAGHPGHRVAGAGPRVRTADRLRLHRPANHRGIRDPELRSGCPGGGRAGPDLPRCDPEQPRPGGVSALPARGAVGWLAAQGQ
jgi:4-cresol dehydrogenase (hydroxylating)